MLYLVNLVTGDGGEEAGVVGVVGAAHDGLRDVRQIDVERRRVPAKEPR